METPRVEGHQDFYEVQFKGINVVTLPAAMFQVMFVGEEALDAGGVRKVNTVFTGSLLRTFCYILFTGRILW